MHISTYSGMFRNYSSILRTLINQKYFLQKYLFYAKRYLAHGARGRFDIPTLYLKAIQKKGFKEYALLPIFFYSNIKRFLKIQK